MGLSHMNEELHQDALDEKIASYIFYTSAGLAGTCLTVISIFKISTKLQNIASMGEELLSVDAGIFLISCILSFLTLKSKKKSQRQWLGKITDVIFLVALCIIAIVCGLITYELKT